MPQNDPLKVARSHHPANGSNGLMNIRHGVGIRGDLCFQGNALKVTFCFCKLVVVIRHRQGFEMYIYRYISVEMDYQ